MCWQEGWIREKEQILSSEDHGKDLTGALRLLSQHKALEDEMSGRAAHLQQTIKQGEELVANQHFGAQKIQQRIEDIQVGLMELLDVQQEAWETLWVLLIAPQKKVHQKSPLPSFRKKITKFTSC